MFKEIHIVLFIFFWTRVISEVISDKKNSFTNKPEELKNLPTLLTMQTGNPVYITKQQQINNVYISLILKPKSDLQTIDIHKYDPNTNTLKTIFIVPPKTKKNCDHDTDTLPPVQTEKPRTPPCHNIKTSEEPTTTISTTTVSRITKRPCELTIPDISPTIRDKVTSTLSTLNQITPEAIMERMTRAPVVDDGNGSTKFVQDGVYRAEDISCEQFYVCINGIQHLMDCPYEQVFNKELKICDWLENVSNCKTPAFEDFSCPEDGYGTDGELILNFRYRDSCSQYVACHKRKARLLSCDSEYYFHEESSTCMNFRSSSNCRDVWYSY